MPSDEVAEHAAADSTARLLLPGSTATQRKSRSNPMAEADFLSDGEDPELQAASAIFTLNGREVLVRMGQSSIAIKDASNVIPTCFGSNRQSRSVLFSEVLTAAAEEQAPQWWHRASGSHARRHALVIYTFDRDRRKRSHWHPATLRLFSEDAEVVHSYASSIASVARETGQRPQALLIIINPFGGARKARQTWDIVAHPLFRLAGIECKVVETMRMNHAHELVASLSIQELQIFDGIVAVGGDGLFSEALNGTIKIWAEGGDRAAAASNLRLGHIPAGSTDAVAYSLNGTRSASTAALHIALGDRLYLDTMRVDSADGQFRAACCYAAYGYMGDLVAKAEPFRILGSLRYTLSGAFMLLRGRSYRVKITYVPAATNDSHRQMPCRVGCSVCAAAGIQRESVASLHTPSAEVLAASASQAVTVEGEYKSVMVIVTPCRSDLSAQGLSPLSHLADGRLTLALVKRCSIAQYLRFLILIPRTGVRAGMLQYVHVEEAAAVAVTPRGRESAWNVDGELLANNDITTAVHHAVIPVFARGVE